MSRLERTLWQHPNFQLWLGRVVEAVAQEMSLQRADAFELCVDQALDAWFDGTSSLNFALEVLEDAGCDIHDGLTIRVMRRMGHQASERSARGVSIGASVESWLAMWAEKDLDV